MCSQKLPNLEFRTCKNWTLEIKGFYRKVPTFDLNLRQNWMKLQNLSQSLGRKLEKNIIHLYPKGYD